MDQNKKVTIDDKRKVEAIEENSECSTWKSLGGTDSKTLEKQLNQEIESFESDLIKKINELKLKISAKNTEYVLKDISSTTPSDWLSL
ncbi:hypothetical protein P3S67_019423 [Capsicum chacoense]